MVKQSEPSWGVVCTAAEPPELLAAFAAHHLALGAKDVRIFIDNADPAAFDLLSKIPGCSPILCDEAHWASRTDTLQRPRQHTRRQRVNATLAREEMAVDWLAHFDADEFLVLSRDFRAELASQPDDVACLIIMNGERMWFEPPATETSIFSGVLRRRISDKAQLKSFYGEVGQFSAGGLSSYLNGKLMVRTAMPIWIGIHNYGRQGQEDEEVTDLRTAQAESAELCHFEGLTPLQWALKMARYEEIGRLNRPPPRHNRHRYNQVKFVADNKGLPSKIADLVALLKLANPAKRAELEDGSHIAPHGVDPVAALEKLAPGLNLDFSTGRFDAWLAKNRPHLAEFIAAWRALPLS
jgi:hypothetical protein